MAQPAASWNAEATDAKGYWVTTPETVEQVDVVDWDELQPTAERTREEPRALREPEPRPAPPVARKVQQRLPVAPVAQAALPAELDDTPFEVPEFTLSEKPAASAPRQVAERRTWEVIDTFVPDGIEDAPTEEVARPPASNVKVFARSKAFTEAITNDLPGRPKGELIEGPTVPVDADGPATVLAEAVFDEAQAVPAQDAPPRSLGPVARVQVVAEPDPTPEPTPHREPEPTPELPVARRTAAAPHELSLDAKRALARAMAAKALSARTTRPRDPGSLPPVEELESSSVVLPARTQESWSWDEADPLVRAEPAPTPTPTPRRPSLSLVQSAPATEEYADTLATPLPAPPRPDVVVPWPLPSVRPRIGEPLTGGADALAAIEAMDSVSLDRLDTDASLTDMRSPDAASTSWAMWAAIALGTLGLGLAAAVGSLAMFALVVLVAILG